MYSWNKIWAKALFRVKAMLAGQVREVRTSLLRYQGMLVGKRTTLPICYVTWPHQVSLGSDCRIEHNVYFHYDGIYKAGPSIKLGNNCFVGTGTEFNITDSFVAGDFCLIAAGTRFIDHDHVSKGPAGESSTSKGISKSIQLGNYVWIGANCVILKGIQIGDGAIIGAGSCVTKDIPANQVWAGNPAKLIRTRFGD